MAAVILAEIDQLQGNGSPLDNLRAVFDSWLGDARREATTGCLFVNTAGEIGPADPAVAQLIEQSTQGLMQAFEQTFRAAQAKGEVNPGLGAADLARQAIAVGDGALLRSCASGDPSFAEAAFRSFLMLIEG